MTWFFLLLAGTIALRISSQKKDFFSPAVFFVLLYAVLLAVNFLRLTPLQTPWSPTTHVLFWSSLGLYLCGCVIVYLLFHVKKISYRFSFPDIRSQLHEDALNLDWRRFRIVWIICTGIFLLAFMSAFAITGNVPVLAADPNEARMEFFGASLLGSYGMHFGPLSLMLACEMLLFMPQERKSFLSIGIISFIVFAFYAMIVTRIDIFRTILFCFVLINYGKRRISLKHMTVLMSFGILLFVAFSLIRVSQSATEAIISSYQFKIPRNMAWSVNMYVYLANNFWNFDYGVQKFIDGNDAYNFGYGFHFLRGFYFLFLLEDPFLKMFGLESLYNPAITKMHGLNTVVFPWHFYSNFGIFGVFFFSLIMGLVISLFYRNTFLHATLFRIVLWGLIIGVLFTSFMIPYWEFWMLYMNIFFFALAHGKIKGLNVRQHRATGTVGE
jgi:oligosaccharide repeat unit polymerase